MVTQSFMTWALILSIIVPSITFHTQGHDIVLPALCAATILWHFYRRLGLRDIAPRLAQWVAAVLVSLIAVTTLTFIPKISSYATSGARRLMVLAVVLTIIGGVVSWRQRIRGAPELTVAALLFAGSSIPWGLFYLSGLATPAYAYILAIAGQTLGIGILTTSILAEERYRGYLTGTKMPGHQSARASDSSQNKAA